MTIDILDTPFGLIFGNSLTGNNFYGANGVSITLSNASFNLHQGKYNYLLHRYGFSCMNLLEEYGLRRVTGGYAKYVKNTDVGGIYMGYSDDTEKELLISIEHRRDVSQFVEFINRGQNILESLRREH